MGTIRFIDTRSSPDGTVSTIEYEFSDYADFKDYQESQRKAVSAVINNVMFAQGLDGEGDDSPLVDIKVEKKETKH